VGNRGYTGSPTADTYRCADGWLATAANTPAQFRKLLTAVLGLQALCDDGRALDLASFNAPAGGFVVAKDLDYLRNCFRDAFAGQSAADMEVRLNAVGVPAARVRRLGEFLRETDGTDCVTLPDYRFTQNGHTVRTAGLGFDAAQDGGPSVTGAETLGQSTREVLAYLGVSPELMDRLAKAGVLKGD
jgi:crotonobetainyl-CoA:carnitine CoA-transferase CaiB-like acyl-CoA transferase